MFNRDAMQERKGELAGGLITAPLVRHSVNFISPDAAAALLQHSAADAFALLFPPELRDSSLISLVNQYGRQIFQMFEVLIRAERSTFAFVREALAEGRINQLHALLNESKELPARVAPVAVATRSLPALALSSIAPLTLFSVGRLTNSIAGRLFNVPESRFTVGFCNQGIDTLMAPAFTLVASNAINAYATATVSTGAIMTTAGSAVATLGIACLVFKGLTYSIANIYQREREALRGPEATAAFVADDHNDNLPAPQRR